MLRNVDQTTAKKAAKSRAEHPLFKSMDALQFAAACELIEMMKQEPISIDMSDYFGFEKVGSLRKSLTTIALLQFPVHWITIRYTKWVLFMTCSINS